MDQSVVRAKEGEVTTPLEVAQTHGRADAARLHGAATTPASFSSTILLASRTLPVLDPWANCMSTIVACEDSFRRFLGRLSDKANVLNYLHFYCPTDHSVID